MASDDTVKQFWGQVFDLLVLDFGHGHPRTWTKPVAHNFLRKFHQKLARICAQDLEKATLCQVVGPDGTIGSPTIGYTTLYRITKRDGRGDNRSRQMFAIYLGANSYEEFVLEHQLNRSTAGLGRVTSILTKFVFQLGFFLLDMKILSKL